MDNKKQQEVTRLNYGSVSFEAQAIEDNRTVLKDCMVDLGIF